MRTINKTNTRDNKKINKDQAAKDIPKRVEEISAQLPSEENSCEIKSPKDEELKLVSRLVEHKKGEFSLRTLFCNTTCLELKNIPRKLNEISTIFKNKLLEFLANFILKDIRRMKKHTLCNVHKKQGVKLKKN